MSGKQYQCIGDYQIWIEGTWCEATKNGKVIYSESVSDDATPEKVYKYLTAKLEFILKDKVICSYDLLNTFQGERENTRSLLAFENKCGIEEITTRVNYQSISE